MIGAPVNLRILSEYREFRNKKIAPSFYIDVFGTHSNTYDGAFCKNSSEQL